MAEIIRYLVSVDAATGATLKVERVGDSGELTEVPAGTFGGAPHACPPSVVFNVFVGQGGVSVGTQPASGMGPQPAAGMGPQPTSGMGPQPTSGMGPQPTSGMGPQPTSGMGPQPTRGPGSRGKKD